MSAAEQWFAAKLRESPAFRAAAFGAEFGDDLKVWELAPDGFYRRSGAGDMITEAITTGWDLASGASGLIVDEASFARLGLPPSSEPFRPGYRWGPRGRVLPERYL